MVPTAVLATKLFAPIPRTQLVLRPRLIEILNGGLTPGHRLIVLSAPAGFGKTTVLGEWLNSLNEGAPAKVGVGWYSLDTADNDLPRFLVHLIAALGNAGVQVANELVERLDTTAASTILTELINVISSTGDPSQPVVLILDDYHAIHASAVVDAVTFLLEHLPPQLHVVIATRADPALALAKLRSRGQLLEIRATDLRFNLPEGDEFLNGLMGLNLDIAHVRTLNDRSEGWVTGLQLAGLSLRGHRSQDEIAEFIEAFTGGSRFIVDFLVDEVLAKQSKRVRDFLLCTSVLAELTGPLCDAVIGGTGGSGLLKTLERENLFLFPLDDHRQWYRYHQLFADVLLARLLTADAGFVAQLHQRASSWFSGHGRLADAVRHSIAANDYARAAFLIESAIPELRRTRQDALMLSWLPLLPAEVIRRSPVLSLLAAWSGLMAGDLDAAEACLNDSEVALAAGRKDKTLAAGWAPTTELRAVPANILIYRASLAQARGDIVDTARYARRALELADDTDHFIRAAASGFLGLATWATGDIPGARTTFTDAVHHLQAAGNYVDALDGTVVLADLWLASGHPSRARQIYQQALDGIAAGKPPFPRSTADFHVGLAEIDREMDDLDGAQRHLATARTLAEGDSITENRHRWSVVMAQVCAASGDYAAAMDHLSAAEALYRRGFYPEVRPISAVRARMQIAQGDLESAEAWARAHRVTVDDKLTYLTEYEHLTLARLLIAKGHSTNDPADPVLFLGRLVSAAAQRTGSLFEIQILLALAYFHQGDQGQSFAALAQAWRSAPEPDNHLRLLLDEGLEMMGLLAAAAVTPEVSDLLPHRLFRYISRPSEGKVQVSGLIDPLSDRELEVLTLLDGELSGPEIARQLFVSLNTLRTHTKRIYLKLGINNRSAAVRRGRELGILRRD